VVDLAEPRATHRRAVPAVALAIVLWSASALSVRAGHADAMTFTAWRLWFALPPLAAIVAIRKRNGAVRMLRPPRMSRVRWAFVIAGAGFFFSSGAVTAFAALNKTRLLDVTLIGALQPVVIIAFAVAFLGERIERSKVLLAVVAVAGTALVALSTAGGGDWSTVGELLAVASLFLNVGWFLYGRIVRDRDPVDPFAFLLWVLFAAALIVTPLAAIGDKGLHLPAAAIGYAFLTMILGTTAHVLVIWAHRYMPASVSAPFLLAEPPLVAIAAWICFGEALGVWEIVGSAVVVAALWGMVRTPVLDHVEDGVPDIAPPA